MWWDDPKRGVPLIILLGLLLGIGYNLVLKEPLPWIAEKKQTAKLDSLGGAPANTTETADGNVNWLGVPESEFPIDISLDQTKKLFDSGEVILLDAREETDYIEGHIRGAISAPYDDVSADPDWLDAMAANQKVIIAYCDGGECELSINLGFAVTQAGHRRVCVFEDGYPAWKEAGYPTRMGEKP